MQALSFVGLLLIIGWLAIAFAKVPDACFISSGLELTNNMSSIMYSVKIKYVCQKLFLGYTYDKARYSHGLDFLSLEKD